LRRTERARLRSKNPNDPATKSTQKRIQGIFIYDETGRWLATTKKSDFARLDNSDCDYFQRHRASSDRETRIDRPIKSRSADSGSSPHRAGSIIRMEVSLAWR